MLAVEFSILNQKATPAIYADTLANRPDASFAGRIFINTASPYGVYRDTGSAWVQIASNGGGGSSTGVNGLNGTTNIGLGGTLSSNTIIAQNAKNITFSKTGTETFNVNSLYNFDYTDVSNYRHLIQPNGTGALNLFVGNATSSTNALLQIHDNKIKTYFNGTGQFGLLLNDTSGKFVLGDYNNDRKYNSIVVNDDTDRFYFTTTKNQANTDQDLFYASTNPGANERFVKLGDFNNYTNGVAFYVDDYNKTIYATLNNNKVGLDLDYLLDIFTFGSASAVIKCESVNDKIIFETKNLQLDGLILNTTVTTPSVNTIPISINGTQYYINLST